MPSVDINFTFRLLAEDNFRKLVLKLKRIFLYQIKNKDLKKELDALCKELNDINEERNDFIHAVFVLIEKRGIIRFKLKPDIHIAPSVFEEKPIKQEDIDNFIDRLIKAQKSLSSFDEKITKLFAQKDKLKEKELDDILDSLIPNEKEKNGNTEKENQEKT